ncbi:MAG: type II toxin-antitoxin system VapB family antitoxin [Actinobacteria bacterium]|nr:type II toxin-antitoxin system VapB family antitoxin [Actinomycetota bacterium]
MTKRLVEIRDELLADARHALGTTTIKDTVTVALERAVKQAALRRQLTDASLKRFGSSTSDLLDPEVMARAWQ